MITRFSAFLSSAAFVKLKEPVMTVFTIDDDDLVVSDGVLIVDEGGYFRIGKEGRGAVLFRSLAHVQDNLYFHPSLVRVHECLCYGCGGKGIGLHEYVFLGPVYLLRDGFGAPSTWTEIDLSGCVVQRESGGSGHG